jgi:hypothetical protein
MIRIHPSGFGSFLSYARTVHIYNVKAEVLIRTVVVTRLSLSS